MHAFLCNVCNVISYIRATQPRRPRQLCCGNTIYSISIFSLREKCTYNFATTWQQKFATTKKNEFLGLTTYCFKLSGQYLNKTFDHVPRSTPYLCVVAELRLLGSIEQLISHMIVISGRGRHNFGLFPSLLCCLRFETVYLSQQPPGK